jgi:hypothetical protein
MIHPRGQVGDWNLGRGLRFLEYRGKSEAGEGSQDAADYSAHRVFDGCLWTAPPQRESTLLAIPGLAGGSASPARRTTRGPPITIALKPARAGTSTYCPSLTHMWRAAGSV